MTGPTLCTNCGAWHGSHLPGCITLARTPLALEVITDARHDRVLVDLGQGRPARSRR